MDLIQPAEISGKIMTLIDQAKKQVIIVSPYNKINYWKKLTQRIEKAKDRGVEFKWYIRKDIPGNAEPIRQLGINPIEIENLHCKLYMNEKQAVVTSMNLHEYSDTSSLDIGYSITDADMYNDLVNFIDTYIDSSAPKASEIKTVPVNVEVVNESQVQPPWHNTHDTVFRKHLIDFLHDYKVKHALNFEIDKDIVAKLKVRNFLENFDLYLDSLTSCFRIDLRINTPYKEKTRIYKLLLSQNEYLNNLCGEAIEFGSEMKRLKIDFKFFENYRYETWTNKEFELMKPRLVRVLDTYIRELGNIIQQN